MKLTTSQQFSERRGANQGSLLEDEEYWREYLGECLDTDDVLRLLGLASHEALDDLVARHEILAIPTAQGTAFPGFQFIRGQIDPTVSRVVRIFSDVVATSYTTASWLRGARFDGKSVAEWLESGMNPEVVIQAAEESAARLAA